MYARKQEGNFKPGGHGVTRIRVGTVYSCIAPKIAALQHVPTNLNVPGGSAGLNSCTGFIESYNN